MAPQTQDDIASSPIACGALTRRSASAVARLTPALRGRLDLFTYRSILAVPTWGCITEAVVATRAYVTGLEAGLTLLRMTEVYRAHLTPSEGAAHRRALYLFILDMLDRSDEWDGYLAAWAQIRTHTDDALTYRADARLAATHMAHRTVIRSVVHSTRQYENNRAEVSHQPTRQRERQMRRFTSARHALQFLSVHGFVLNLFRVGRHLLRSAHHRLLRTRAFTEWDAVTCAC